MLKQAFTQRHLGAKPPGHTQFSSALALELSHPLKKKVTKALKHRQTVDKINTSDKQERKKKHAMGGKNTSSFISPHLCPSEQTLLHQLGLSSLLTSHLETR